MKIKAVRMDTLLLQRYKLHFYNIPESTKLFENIFSSFLVVKKTFSCKKLLKDAYIFIFYMLMYHSHSLTHFSIR